ncbi:hypothetical protein E2C01_082752 [Portunus trituberculatus]|uniref:Uncharacterized protein n=1 Tax=Portunus trituberculatus TaxID=210409 RepID=A0A5B7IQR6_PORTR|nr:hypothetical protein [Portunus trituberculatus]
MAVALVTISVVSPGSRPRVTHVKKDLRCQQTWKLKRIRLRKETGRNRPVSLSNEFPILWRSYPAVPTRLEAIRITLLDRLHFHQECPPITCTPMTPSRPPAADVFNFSLQVEEPQLAPPPPPLPSPPPPPLSSPTPQRPRTRDS